MSDEQVIAEEISEETEVAQHRARQIIEALLFASSEPLSLQRIREVIDTFHSFKPKEIREFIDELNDTYKLEEHSFHITEIGEGFLLRTNAEFHPYLDVLFRKKNTGRISKAGMEVLSIIAYKQPLTRAQIEEIRGVDCSSLIQTLMERELIESAGKLESPGRPTLYRTSKGFLNYFGLKDHSDLENFNKE